MASPPAPFLPTLCQHLIALTLERCYRISRLNLPRFDLREGAGGCCCVLVTEVTRHSLLLARSGRVTSTPAPGEPAGAGPSHRGVLWPLGMSLVWPCRPGAHLGAATGVSSLFDSLRM